MIKCIKLAAWAITSSLFSASLAQANTLTVNVTNIKTFKGNLMVALHNDEMAYGNNTAPAASKKIKADGPNIAIHFPDLQEGTYALKLFHDENSNGALDTNLIGIPTEGYGFSNNSGNFGPASFKEAKFTLNDDKQIEVKLRN